MPAEKRRGVLSPADLEVLTDSWAAWVDNAPTLPRRLVRLRLHLFFLLARFGGLRTNEIFAFSPANIDLATGFLQINGRSIFLPVRALRPLRRILSLEEAGRQDFLQLDAGFLRRSFYAVAELAHLAPSLCAPRALRYARALELLSMQMPPGVVAKALDFKNPLQLAHLLQQAPDVPQENRTENCLTGLVTSLETDNFSARLYLQITPSAALCCITSLPEILAVEPILGQTINIYIPPEAIFPAKALPECANRLDCCLLAHRVDRFRIFLSLMVSRNCTLTAALDRDSADLISPMPKEKIAVHIPPHLIQLRRIETRPL